MSEKWLVGTLRFEEYPHFEMREAVLTAIEQEEELVVEADGDTALIYEVWPANEASEHKNFA